MSLNPAGVMNTQFQILHPFVYDIYGDSFKEAVKNFIKINHNMNIQDIIIRDQANTQKYRAEVKYYTEESKRKAGITMYPANNFMIPSLPQTPLGYLEPVITNPIPMGGVHMGVMPMGGVPMGGVIPGHIDRKYVHNNLNPVPLSNAITPMVLGTDNVQIGDSNIRFTGYRPLDGGGDVFSDTPDSPKLSVVLGSNISPINPITPMFSTHQVQQVELHPFVPVAVGAIADIAPSLQLSDTASELLVRRW